MELNKIATEVLKEGKTKLELVDSLLNEFLNLNLTHCAKKSCLENVTLNKFGATNL